MKEVDIRCGDGSSVFADSLMILYLLLYNETDDSLFIHVSYQISSVLRLQLVICSLMLAPNSWMKDPWAVHYDPANDGHRISYQYHHARVLAARCWTPCIVASFCTQYYTQHYTQDVALLQTSYWSPHGQIHDQCRNSSWHKMVRFFNTGLWRCPAKNSTLSFLQFTALKDAAWLRECLRKCLSPKEQSRSKGLSVPEQRYLDMLG